MKQPKRLTLELKKAASAYHLNPDDWMLQKDSGGSYVTLVNKRAGITKTIDRHVRTTERR